MAHRHWTVEEKRAAVERMKSCGHDKLAAELKGQRRQLYAWRAQLKRLDAGGSAAPESKKQQRKQEKQCLQAALANKVWKWNFPKMPCAESRLDAGAAAAVARLHLRTGRNGSVRNGEGPHADRDPGEDGYRPGDDTNLRSPNAVYPQFDLRDLGHE